MYVLATVTTTKKKKKTVHILPSISETKFHTHTKQRKNYSSVYFSLCTFLTAKWKTKDSPQHDTIHSRVQAALNFLMNEILIC
jgi:hypothetical protein